MITREILEKQKAEIIQNQNLKSSVDSTEKNRIDMTSKKIESNINIEKLKLSDSNLQIKETKIMGLPFQNKLTNHNINLISSFVNRKPLILNKNETLNPNQSHIKVKDYSYKLPPTELNKPVIFNVNNLKSDIGCVKSEYTSKNNFGQGSTILVSNYDFRKKQDITDKELKKSPKFIDDAHCFTEKISFSANSIKIINKKAQNFGEALHSSESDDDNNECVKCKSSEKLYKNICTHKLCEKCIMKNSNITWSCPIPKCNLNVSKNFPCLKKT